MTLNYRVDGIDTRPGELRIAELAREWDAMTRIDGSPALYTVDRVLSRQDVCEDDAHVATLYDIAWRLYNTGDIDAPCLNDLLDITFR